MVWQGRSLTHPHPRPFSRAAGEGSKTASFDDRAGIRRSLVSPTIVVGATLLATALVACGQKGALYVPGYPRNTVWPMPATPPAPVVPASIIATPPPAAPAATAGSPAPAAPAASVPVPSTTAPLSTTPQPGTPQSTPDNSDPDNGTGSKP
jgi:predicted small lipoprotein YifL